MDVNKATIIPYTEDLTILVTGDDFDLEDIETVSSFFLPGIHHSVYGSYSGVVNRCGIMPDKLSHLSVYPNMIILRSRKIEEYKKSKDLMVEYFYSAGAKNVWEPLIEAKLKELNKEEN